MNNNFLLRSLSLRKGNNVINSSSNAYNQQHDLLHDTKLSFKPFGAVGSALFDIKREEENFITLFVC